MRWRTDLESWAIPEEILAAAPESPWGFPPGIFREAAARAIEAERSPTHRRALDALPRGGSVLDVGAGAGAASLPLAPPAARIVAVDQSRRMLDELRRLATAGIVVDAVEGTWPDVAGQVGPVDVGVCAHVAYNVADLDRFVLALTERCWARVVLELTAAHPLASLSPLWKHFWDLDRPTEPTAEDAKAVIAEVLGEEPQSVAWSRAHPLAGGRHDDTVAWTRRRLCLTADRDVEIGAMVQGRALAPVGMVTLWWAGRA